MYILMVDATTYKKQIDEELRNLKQQYFKIKNIVRFQQLGEHIPPKQRTYSIGLLRIATILKANGHIVEYVEFSNLKDLINKKEIEPDIIAFSAVCPTVPLCSEFIEKYRYKLPKVRFVLGGPQLNVAPQTTKKLFNNFDVYSVGYDISAAEQIVGEQLYQAIEPYIDFSLLPLEIKEYSINTFSTLGCPFSCNYCQDRLIPYYSAYDDGNISFFQRYLPQKSCIHFFDSVLGSGNEKRISKICEEIYKTGHNFVLSCDFRADLINKQIIKDMVKAGFKEIRLGAESADDELLSFNKRYLKTNKLTEAIQMIRDYSDMYISLYSAIGFPGSTYENVQATIGFFSSLLESRSVDEIKNCIFVPYPFDEPRFSEKDIVIQNYNWKDYDRQSFPVFDLSHLNAMDIWRLFIEMTSAINQSWIKGFSINECDLELQPMYGEYIVNNYV